MKRILSLLLIILLSLGLVSCKDARQSALSELQRSLNSDYTCNVAFETKSSSEQPLVGACTLTRKGAKTTIKITAPEQLCNLTLEYDVSGAPSFIAVHFKDYDLSLPSGALSRINAVASLATNDFVRSLSRLSADEILPYGTAEDEEGYIVSVPYDNAEITLCFSKDGSKPYRLEHTVEDIVTSVELSDFVPDITEIPSPIEDD